MCVCVCAPRSSGWQTATCDVSGVAQAVCRPKAGPPVPPDPSAVAVSQPQRATTSCCGNREKGRAEWEEYTPSRTQLPLGWRREALILRLWICSVILLIGLVSFLANSPPNFILLPLCLFFSSAPVSQTNPLDSRSFSFAALCFMLASLVSKLSPRGLYWSLYCTAVKQHSWLKWSLMNNICAEILHSLSLQP